MNEWKQQIMSRVNYKLDLMKLAMASKMKGHGGKLCVQPFNQLLVSADCWLGTGLVES